MKLNRSRYWTSRARRRVPGSQGDKVQYGYFDDERREYVVTRPDTPLPWMNYLGTEDHFGMISNTAGGCSFYRDARLRRLTRYRHNNAPFDLGGRYLYLRDETDGDYWSPSWQPTRSLLDAYECRHGLSYTSISSQPRRRPRRDALFRPSRRDARGLAAPGAQRSRTRADLSVFSSVEFCLWDAQDDSTNFQRNFSVGEVEVEDGVIYHKTEYRERRNHFAYFACSEPLAGFDTAARRLPRSLPRLGPPARGGARECRQLDRARMGAARLPSRPARARPARDARDRLRPRLLRRTRSPRSSTRPGSQIINKRTVQAGDRALAAARGRWRRACAACASYWDELLSASSRSSTPDMHTNRMVNIWNAYQCMATFKCRRSTSFYESGIGRGMGFRDSNQDLLGFVHMVPARARERILDLAATQLPTGGAYHQYQPLTKRGNNDIGGGFNDDPHWLVLGGRAYLKETGDSSILDEPVPYDNAARHRGAALRAPAAQLPLHPGPAGAARPAADRPRRLERLPQPELLLRDARASPSRPPRTERAGSRSRSSSPAQFVLASSELAAVARLRGDGDEAASLEAAACRMVVDGRGPRVGRRVVPPCLRLTRRRRRLALERGGTDLRRAARDVRHGGDRHLEREGCGCPRQRQGPTRNRARDHARATSVHPIPPRARRDHVVSPGYKENGGVFCQVNPWIMIAETILGDGDAAFDYYKRTNPSARAPISDVHRCEPYVYAQMIAGRDAATPGEAKNSWLTGSASWHLTAISQWILGVRPELGGLRIDPVLPPTWPGFTARRRWRGATYEIVVHQEQGTKGRVRRLVVDGKILEGNLVCPAPAGSTVRIEATVAAE